MVRDYLLQQEVDHIGQDQVVVVHQQLVVMEHLLVQHQVIPVVMEE